MHKYNLQFFFIFFSNLFFYYFIFFFNILYNKIYLNKIIQVTQIYKNSTTFYIYYFFILLNIIIFIIYYIIFIFKIIQILNISILKNIINKNKKIIVLVFKVHYDILKDISLMKDIKYNQKEKYFLDVYLEYNMLYYKYYIIYLKEFLHFNYYLWILSYFIRFYRKVKNNEKYTISYILRSYKNKLFDKIHLMIEFIINKIKSKIPERSLLWMAIKYYCIKFKKFCINSYNFIVNKITDFIFSIKYFYYIYILNSIFYIILKNKGNLIIYYIFLFLKYTKSFLIYVWKTDIIYKILKKLERKKWWFDDEKKKSDDDNDDEMN